MFMKLLVDVDPRIYRHAFLSVLSKQSGFESVLAAVFTRVVLKINGNLFATHNVVYFQMKTKWMYGGT